MIRILKLARKAWRIYFLFCALVVFLILYPFFYPLVHRKKWFRKAFQLKKVFSGSVLFLSGVRYSVKAEEAIDRKKTYIYCSNHSSYLDIILSYLVIPSYFHMMGKAELTRVPLFKIFFRKMNIPVERSSLKDSHRAFVRAGNDIEEGTSMFIFPEGTIPNHTPRLGRFKNGPFKLAIEKQVPIIPVTFLNNWEILPDGRKKENGGKPGVSRVILHKPIPTQGMTEEDVSMLRDKVHDVINQTLRKQFQR